MISPRGSASNSKTMTPPLSFACHFTSPLSLCCCTMRTFPKSPAKDGVPVITVPGFDVSNTLGQPFSKYPPELSDRGSALSLKP